MILGIATEVSIFLLSEWRADAAGGGLVEAGAQRLRPIVMTTVAAILALLPLALGLGAGAAMQVPLARAIVIGLFLQLPGVLLLLPALLRLTGAQPRWKT